MRTFNPTFSGKDNAENLVTALEQQARFGVRYLREWASELTGVPFEGDKGMNIKRMEWVRLEPAVKAMAGHIANFAVTRKGFAMEQGLKRLETDYRNAFDELGGFSIRLSNKPGRLEPGKAYKGEEARSYLASMKTEAEKSNQALACWKPSVSKKTDILEPTERLKPMAVDPSPSQADLLAQERIDKAAAIAAAMDRGRDSDHPDRETMVPASRVAAEVERLMWDADSQSHAQRQYVKQLKQWCRLGGKMVKRRDARIAELERENKRLKDAIEKMKSKTV